MSDDVYSRLRDLLAEGVYLGGDVLPENELASRLGVSRTPVREALKRLQTEGHVAREAHRRAKVVETDFKQVVHIFAARAALEPQAVRLAIGKVDTEFLDKLRCLTIEMDNAITRETPDRRRYRELNARFHQAIWHQSGDRYFEELVYSIARKPLVSPTFNNWTVQELKRSNRQHEDLVCALEAGDAVWACSIMNVHLLSARAAYIRIGRASGELSSALDF